VFATSPETISFPIVKMAASMTASMQIRDTDPDRDVDELVELMRETEPLTLMNAAAWVHRERSVPPRAGLRAFVAEVDGRVVGESWALRAWFATGERALVYVSVREHARRRGIGSALYDVALAHARTLGTAHLSSAFHENDAGVAFAVGRGFAEARAERLSSVDPRTIAEEPATELRPASAVDPRILHRIDDAAMRDVPQLDDHEPSTYQEWAEHVLANPLLQPDGSFVAYADGEPAAMSLLIADLESGRAGNMFTGTLAEFRGRGLGLAAKLGSLRWAAEHGVTQVVTLNDETNAPMLAINRRLGYEPAGRRIEVALRLR